MLFVWCSAESILLNFPLSIISKSIRSFLSKVRVWEKVWFWRQEIKVSLSFNKSPLWIFSPDPWHSCETCILLVWHFDCYFRINFYSFSWFYDNLIGWIHWVTYSKIALFFCFFFLTSSNYKCNNSLLVYICVFVVVTTVFHILLYFYFL